MTLKNKVKSGIRMLTPPTKLGKIYALAALISTPIAGTLGLELYTSKYHPKENLAVKLKLGSAIDKVFSPFMSCNPENDYQNQEGQIIDMETLSPNDIALETIVTTNNGSNEPQGGIIYVSNNAIFVPAFENQYNPSWGNLDKLIENLNNTDRTIKPALADEGEGGKVIRIPLSLPSPEILSNYLSGEVPEQLKTNPKYKGHFLVKTENGWEAPESRSVRKDKIKDKYEDAASVLTGYGVNFVFGPVLDLVPEDKERVPNNIMVTQQRSYGDDLETVLELATLYTEVMHSKGIDVIAKHYVGTGFIKGDSHDGNLNGSTRNMFDEEVEVSKKVFKKMSSSIEGIMITHNKDSDYEMIDSVNPEVYQEIRSFFDGIIITDDMSMGSVKVMYEPRFGDDWLMQACLDAYIAGADAIILKNPDDAEDLRARLVEKMAYDSEFKQMMDEKSARMIEFKGLNVLNENLEQPEQLIADVTVSDTDENGPNADLSLKPTDNVKAQWVPVKVKSGDTLLGLIATEDSDIAFFNSRGQPAIRNQDEFNSIKETFIKINNVQPDGMRAGSIYLVPDLNLDGQVSDRESYRPVPVVEEATRVCQIRELDDLPTVSHKFKRGETLYSVLSNMGVEVTYPNSRRSLPLTSGPLAPIYQQFKIDNPNAPSNPRRLMAGETFQFREYNDLHCDGSTTSNVDTQNNQLVPAQVQSNTTGDDLIRYKVQRGQLFYGFLAGEGINVRDSREEFLPLKTGTLSGYYQDFKNANQGFSGMNDFDAGKNFLFVDINNNGRIDYKKID
ncbi:glycoside hydrolase family 3 protein [archaeon]|jgi:beta-glucosidase-like glycosyl hydrolase|nr:glycoside hydrolase family 3 protein [archaeon]MBT3450563.1 glycoside hydrolase family 3 protein [archaeon]MBT6868417.1 glycoside hydrolase family 3 protein [archaeon]MBT7193516.1 glycoside hydrolase family 3 protein [archaeon]MBT7381289.1 glycoside hydrolase family 3 protein [archaeon]